MPAPAPPWTWSQAFALLSAIRFVSAMYNTISDCDEVFNYWEPMHFMLYGTGLQTWEYRWRIILLAATVQ
jgi:alpha-1,2-mannosyltransferase